jgi:hypothetical protein
MSDGTGLLFLAGCYLLGGAIVSRVRVPGPDGRDFEYYQRSSGKISL